MTTESSPVTAAATTADGTSWIRTTTCLRLYVNSRLSNACLVPSRSRQVAHIEVRHMCPYEPAYLVISEGN